jgi:transmembrane sensor
MVADTYQNNNNSKIVLSDGSVVYLNANSKLYYPTKFDGKNRTIEFEGDAFFEITKNPQKPFVIKAKDSEIRVLGTSFNVNTNLESKDIEVLVETGKVRLSSLENKNIYVDLKPGFIGAINKNQISAKKNIDKNYLSWKTKIFDFTENINLGEAVDILNRAFHANIKCEGDVVYNKKLNSTFTSEDSLDKILNIICDSQGVTRQPKNNEIILSIN